MAQGDGKYNLSRRRFRILSLDDGGARGLFTAHILARLIEEEPRLLDSVDLIAGTSTGALIGVLLSNGTHPSHIAELYKELARPSPPSPPSTPAFLSSWIEWWRDPAQFPSLSA